MLGTWRKFDEALRVLPPDKRASPAVALEGLSFCNKLFETERELGDATPEERYRARLEKSVPVLNDFWEWLEKQSSEVLPQSLLGQAIKYCQSQWGKLQNFLRDGRLEIDNNRCERSIKPFVIGRKGWLFCNTPKGARASAVIYSIVETAKENGLIPFEYLRDEFLPWSPSLPETCRARKDG